MDDSKQSSSVVPQVSSLRKRKRSSEPTATSALDAAAEDLDPETRIKHAKAVDETLKELDAIFEFMEQCKSAALQDREEADGNRDLPLPKEYMQKLSIFLEIVQPNIVSGEPTVQVRFTSKYKNLSVASKIRLLKISQREEIAMDILQNYFTNLSDYHRILLLEASPVKKVPIASEIWKSFGAMTPPYRASFINAVPVDYLLEVVLKQANLLSVGEVLQGLKRLPDGASHKLLKRSMCGALWARKAQFHYPDDFLDFASVIETNSLPIKFFPIVEEMSALARTLHLEHLKTLQREAELKNEFNSFQLSLAAKPPIDIEFCAVFPKVSSSATFAVLNKSNGFKLSSQRLPADTPSTFSIYSTRPLGDNTARVFFQYKDSSVQMIGVISDMLPWITCDVDKQSPFERIFVEVVPNQNSI